MVLMASPSSAASADLSRYFVYSWRSLMGTVCGCTGMRMKWTSSYRRSHVNPNLRREPFFVAYSMIFFSTSGYTVLNDVRSSLYTQPYREQNIKHAQAPMAMIMFWGTWLCKAPGLDRTRRSSECFLKVLDTSVLQDVVREHRSCVGHVYYKYDEGFYGEVCICWVF